jgi:multidrug efflux pump subunit AcrB
MANQSKTEITSGGLAQFFVEHKEVSWMALVAVLLLGIAACLKLGQQEDPTFPKRTAMLVTAFPGANASKVEELVTKPLERKISELQSIDEIASQSRPGISALTIKLQPASEAFINQEWDKMRAKLAEAELPEGARAPYLNTDFGNTITLLFAITSPSITEAECIARAELVRNELAAMRQGQSATNRAAVIAFFPSSVAQSYREFIRHRFETGIRAAGLADQVETRQGQSYILADLKTSARRAGLEAFIDGLARNITGSDKEQYHADFTTPILLMGDEDPLPAVRATAPARYSYRKLEIMARELEDQLKQLPSVGKVTKIGIVQEAVYLLYSGANIAGYNFAPDQVMEAIAARNAIIPGGTMRTEGRNFPVEISGEFRNDEELGGAVVGVGRSGAPVYLRDLFEIRRMYESPVPYKVDVLTRDDQDGPLQKQRAVMVAVEMKEGRIIRHFNQEVRQTVADLLPRLPEGVRIQTLSDQPAAVDQRIGQFARCFGEAVLIVIIVALFLMNWRSALVVATAIPLTVAMTLAGMKLLDIPLDQISIAALIIALGMLVDVPVVASDGINRELHHGEPRGRAAWLGPYRLRRPMIFGTLINIVAFLPLVLLPGDKGVFIFALPAVVTLALLSSLLVSVTFTPLMGYYFLRGQKGFDEGAEVRSFFLFRPLDLALRAILPHYQAALESGLRHPWVTLGAAYGLLALSLGLVPSLGTQFFPAAERNQLLVDIELPATDSLTSMREKVDNAADLLVKHSEIASAALFTGGTAPRFYYNVAPKQPANYLAQILINTRHKDDVPGLIVKLRDELDRKIPGARCTVKQLEQGPPVETPIQIRFSGDDLDVLQGLADEAGAVLRAANGYHVNDDLGLRMPSLRIDMDQDRANSLGVGNRQVGLVAQAAFAGLKVTEMREGDHLIPVYLRLRVEDRNEAEKIRVLYVQNAARQSVPLDSFATVGLRSEYVTIPHFNQLRTVTVKAFPTFGELPDSVLKRARAGLAAIKLPPGYKMELAGEHKELRQNQSEMGLVVKVSLALITLAMVLQFNSVVKSVVVMLTVPLGLIGAFFGLAVTRSPLGFVALLGMVSLAGVIVSHIIVLSDFIEQARAQGMPLKQALVKAGLARLRPVLVTVFATVGGLLPLFLTGGALWHPLASVHIFGLLLATVLTLILLPVLYYVFCEKFKLIQPDRIHP